MQRKLKEQYERNLLTPSPLHPRTLSEQVLMSLTFFLFLLNLAMAATKELRPGYYSKTCPQAEVIVRNVIKKNMAREPRSAASVMRLQFHDCFVNVTYEKPVLSTYTINLSQNLPHFSFMLVQIICRDVMLRCCWMTHQTCLEKNFLYPI